MNLQDLKYAPTHEWVKVDGNQATIGITDFAVSALTDLVYCELPKPGKQLKGGDPFGEVESVKAVSDLYAPVDCEVVAANSALTDDIAKLSNDPFEAGWLIQVKITNPKGLEVLMDRAAYEKHCAAEAH